MGLRFRKSVKIAPGVRLNIGKKSVGVSAGVKGYRKSINSSGRVTTSIGTPVAGVSYVKTENLKSKKKKAASNRASSTAAAASSSASSPAVAAAPVKVQKAAAQPKEKPPKTTAVLQERPDASFVVFGVVVLAGAVFLFASSHVIFSVVAALFGVFCLYSFVHIKLHPEDPRYITEEQLTRWGQLVHSDAKTVSQLQKASVPVLVDLKERAAWHYKQVSSVSFGPDISYNGEALIDVQNQIVALSEFVILQGDNPKHDLEEYSSFVSNKITAFTNDILNG
jgi:hypothetical protein